MKRFASIFLVALVLVGLVAPPVQAQSDEPTPTAEPATQTDTEPTIPLVHVVEEGETLFSIAELYGTTIETLQLLNNISDPALLLVGQQLVIPGGEGEAAATSYVIQVGDTLAGLAADYNTTIEAIAEANRLTNPYYLVAGQPVAVVSRTGSAEPQPITGTALLVQPGDGLLTIAAQTNQSPAAIAASNELPYPSYLYPGQRLRLPGTERYQHLAGSWGRVEMRPATVTQGETVSIHVESLLPGLPTGQFAGQSLHFVAYEDGYVALVGLDAFAEPGRYRFELGGEGEEPWRPFIQDVQVFSGNYGTQYIVVPEEQTHLLAPEIRVAEDDFLATIYTRFSDTPQWTGPFQLPVTNTVVTAGYGDGRSYNEGPIEIYHTGVDFAGATGTPIHAPAAGTVIYSDTLQLRGNTLIIDHGLGVMTGYYHLSRIHANVGDRVMRGQIIAEGGSTGLSSGPHLHWDLRVANVPVNGLQWTQERFP